MSTYRHSRGRATAPNYDDDRYDDRYYDHYDDTQKDTMIVRRPYDQVLEEPRSRSVDRVVRHRSVSRKGVRRSDQKYLVRSSRRHGRPPRPDSPPGRPGPPIYEKPVPPIYIRPDPRPPRPPPVPDRSRSRSRSHSRSGSSSVSYSVSRSRSRSRSRDRSRSRSRDRSRSRSRDRSRSRSTDSHPRPRRRRHHRHRHRHIQKISKATVTKYGVDPRLSNTVPRRPRRESDRKVVRVESSRVVFTRVRVTDISPESLDHFGYPWRWDTDRNWIIIERSCTQEEIDALCQHTREVVRISKRVVVSKPTVTKTTTITTLRPNDAWSRSMVVRKKSALF